MISRKEYKGEGSAPLTVLTLAAIGTLLAGCEPATQGPAPGMGRTPTVTVAEVEARAIADEVSFVGRVGAKNRVDIRAQVQGILLEQHFEDGALVEKGDLLFEIEPVDYEAALNSAKAQVASAEANKDKADRFFERLNSVKSGGVSATDLEQAELDARTAKATLDQMIVAQQVAELDLKRTKITAPIDGQIGKAKMDAGNLVDASSGTLATIVQVDPIRVQHALSERFLTEALQTISDRDPSLPPVRDTLVPRIDLSTGEKYPHEGKIVFLDNEVGSTTGTIQAEAEFPNPNGILKPGQFVDLIVQRGEPIDRITVPQSAVQQDQQGHFVLIVEADGNVSQRRITAGDRVGVDWIIQEGLTAGEKVIIQGIEKVRPGAKVNAVEAGAAPASKASAEKTPSE
ncbi:MAG: efflux RND transporter periplasmic adaptor subunit [Verrucomicrobiales bacterium]|nr:efflux RND transporter periplasmic adaptor subunit [Verrucomicrobiales bacterium]